MNHPNSKKKVIAPVYWVYPDGAKDRLYSSLTILVDQFDHTKGQLTDGRPVIFKDNEWICYFDPDMIQEDNKIELDFDIWFSRFLEEKELSELVLEFEDKQIYNYFPVQVLQQYLSNNNTEIQDRIKTKLVQLDYCNQDIKPFLE